MYSKMNNLIELYNKNIGSLTVDVLDSNMLRLRNNGRVYIFTNIDICYNYIVYLYFSEFISDEEVLLNDEPREYSLV